MNDDPVDFSGQVVLVTGGAPGSGLAIAQRFLEAGAGVAVCGQTDPEGPPSSGDRSASFHTADVSDPSAVDTLVAEVMDEHGRLDVLVNDAGGSPAHDAADAATASPELVTTVVARLLLAPLFVGQAANRVMQEQEEGGAIVNVGSARGLRPSPGAAAYGAAMAGLVNLSQSLAVEWGPKVRVNCVSPGFEADVAPACLFLASPLAAYVSGANLVLDGGGERPAYLDAVSPRSARAGARQQHK